MKIVISLAGIDDSEVNPEKDWEFAIESLMRDDEPLHLAQMLKNSVDEVPQYVRESLALFISSEFYRRRSRRGKHATRLTGGSKLSLEKELERMYQRLELSLALITELADERGVEPREMKDFVMCIKKAEKKRMAKQYGVALKTLDDYVSVADIRRAAKICAGKIDVFGRKVKNGQEDPELLAVALDQARSCLAEYQ